MTGRDQKKKKKRIKHGEYNLFTVILEDFVYSWNLGMFYVCEDLQPPFSVLPS